MKPKPPKRTAETGQDIREFDKLPAKTMELLVLGDSEHPAVG